jgi:probable rRNA maturation factor
MIEVAVSNQTQHPLVVESTLVTAARIVLEGERVMDAALSVAIVDDHTIHQLNRRYLQHDYATDVLSFVLDNGPNGLDGEVIVSADTAARTAERIGVDFPDELLLYLVHGLLHLVGYDDQTHSDRLVMRQRERHYLTRLGIEPRYETDDSIEPTADAR